MNVEPPTPTLFCSPWNRKSSANPTKTYTDADLAADLNALTIQERRVLQEEIHGVADTVQESESFLEDKIAALRNHIISIPPSQREAWDRAVFLRPALESDRSMQLMYLRAAHFQADEAAVLLVKNFEFKKEIFGDDLFHQRITWKDLSEKEQQLVRSGVYQLIRNRESRGRGIGISRLNKWDCSDPVALERALHYCQLGIEDYPEIQQAGVVNAGELRGTWKSPTLQVCQLLSRIAHRVDNLPYYTASIHTLYDNAALNTFIQSFRPLFKQHHRVRHRIHLGSSMEIEYLMRTFGVNLTDCLSPNAEEGPLFQELEEDIRERIRIDEEWRKSEAPYRDPTSRTALVPNPQDILMGKKSKIAAMWSGNVTYHRIVEQQAYRYVEAQGKDRIDKTLITLETIHVLQNQYQARFLIRKETTWEVADSADVQIKVSQALRTMARALSQGKKTKRPMP